ncbi:MAG: RNA 3'-terminal phosphate cyclase [Candidatus Riflebacteria bacterium]|nr:RNA 3'-terminal phosphate cyclase [Candidatus Riflebacteria bacterium]
MIHIDGSTGEGGGQILRTSLALSMCTGKPFRITNIRAKRPKPGLLRQHLTAVNAAQSICQADVTGADISSLSLTFVPGQVNPGAYSFAVGTAGSATLVLQTILPPLLCAKESSTIHLEGGTHNPWAPPFHFLKQAFLPLIERMGAWFSAEITQWGFYPAGGGKCIFRITPPAEKLLNIDLTERGRLIRSEVLTAVANIPWEIADDECKLIARGTRFPIDRFRAENVSSSGPGNVAMLEMEFENSRAFFTGFGEMGTSRNKVAHLVSSSANRFFACGAAIDEHMADQLLIPMALAGKGSFTTRAPTSHTTTNIEIIRSFLDIQIQISEIRKGVWKIWNG